MILFLHILARDSVLLFLFWLAVCYICYHTLFKNISYTFYLLMFNIITKIHSDLGSWIVIVTRSSHAFTFTWVSSPVHVPVRSLIFEFYASLVKLKTELLCLLPLFLLFVVYKHTFTKGGGQESEEFWIIVFLQLEFYFLIHFSYQCFVKANNVMHLLLALMYNKLQK